MPNAFQRQRQVVYIDVDLREAANNLKPAEFAQRILDVVKENEGVELEIEYYPASSWDSGSFSLQGKRLETDDEYAARIAALEEGQRLEAERKARLAEKQLERDRLEYERLKKIFENGA